VPELALLGGPKTKSKPFPDWPQYDENEGRALAEVLESRVWWGTPGTRTLEFEQAFANFHQRCASQIALQTQAAPARVAR